MPVFDVGVAGPIAGFVVALPVLVYGLAQRLSGGRALRLGGEANQARRLGIRYRADDKRLETPHTLNGTAVTDRWLLAILENFGGDVPDALQQLGAPARVRP